MLIQGQVGPTSAQSVGPGSNPVIRQGQLGDVIISELHGRFYEANYRGNVYCDGMALTSISNSTYTVATLGPTVTPIAGVWNPSASSANLVIMQAIFGVTLTSLTATGGGPYMWASSTGNGAITTGNLPLNRKTLTKTGSQAKGLCNTAPTGLTNSLVAGFGSMLYGGQWENVSFVGTAVGAPAMQYSAIEHFDGSLIVPPGGVLALLATTAPANHSAVSTIMWEEVPL